jgi:hypothetical protein
MSDNTDMRDALNALGEHTFRHGAVVATLSGVEATDEMLTVNTVSSATYYDQPVVLDLPMHFVDFPHNGDPLGTAYTIIADAIRTASAR